MSFDFGTWSTGIRRLCDALAVLAPQAEAIGAPLPERDEWYQLLLNKLRPQSFGTPPLVVAVVGGTNIGKSAIFNQLAGEDASSVSPLAAGTKHPVCLCPPGTTDPALLRALFSEFELRPWSAAADALEVADKHLLFWRESKAVPERLLLLDTPDIDSDAQVNWQRADAVRQTADVLIGVLTQQKYYDAAVKKFFTRAAEADKAVILVFNQVDLALDRDIWPTWLDDFCHSTGVRPVRIYVVPYDRKGAQARGLTFYDVGTDGRAATPTMTDLGRELAELRYDDLKSRTLRGALRRVVDPAAGVEGYLARVRDASRHFASALDVLMEARRIDTGWPGLPIGVLVDEVGRWWDERRGSWTRNIHGAYRWVGQKVWSLVSLGQSSASDEKRWLVDYQESEKKAIHEATQKLLEQLERYAGVADEPLRSRLRTLLGGSARETFLSEIDRKYAELPQIDTQFRARLHARLEALEKAYPKTASGLRYFDVSAAFARPVITVGLVSVGMAAPGIDVGIHAVGTALAGEIATATMVPMAGEAAVAGGTHLTMKEVVRGFFRQTQKHYAQERGNQLTEIFDEVILGKLLAELQAGAAVTTSPELRAANEAVGTLRALAS